MKMNKLVVGVVGIVAFGLVGCGGVEGTYKLDKDAMKKNAEAEIAKKPAADQEAAKALLGMFDKMDMTLELKSGGAASMKTTGPTGKDDEKTGTWKKDGDSVVLTSDNGKELKCQKSGNKLTCTKDGKDDSLVFVKS